MFDINLDPVLDQVGISTQSYVVTVVLSILFLIMLVGFFTGFYKDIRKLSKHKTAGIIIIIAVVLLATPLFIAVSKELKFKTLKTDKKYYKVGDDIWITVDATRPYYFYATLQNSKSKKYDLLVYPKKKDLNNQKLLNGEHTWQLFKVSGPALNGVDKIRVIISKYPIDISKFTIADANIYTKSLLTQDFVVVSPVFEDNSIKTKYIDIHILNKNNSKVENTQKVDNNLKIKIDIDSKRYAKGEEPNVTVISENCKYIDIFDVTVNRGIRKIKHYKNNKKEYRFSFQTSKEEHDIGKHLLIGVCSNNANFRANDLRIDSELIKGSTIWKIEAKGNSVATDYRIYNLTY